MAEGDDVEIEDGSEGSEDDDVDIMDFIETDRTLEEEKALVDPQVWLPYSNATGKLNSSGICE
jgi:hypothetical protein